MALAEQHGKIPHYVNGRFEPFLREDDISGVVIDGRSRGEIDENVIGDDRLTFKVQLTGAGEYQFNDAPTSEIAGECLVIAHQPSGVIKRQIIHEDTEERSVTLFLPRLGNGRIAGFEDGGYEVQAASAFLDQRLLFRRYTLPRAAALCASDILDARRSPWTQERYKRARIDELTCLLLDFFISQFKRSDDHGLTEREVRRVQQVRAIMAERLDQPLGIAELASAVGTNRTRLNTIFRAFYGETIGQALQRERMESARTWLGEEDMSISEIAERCGYGHLSNFSLAYKAYFGISPSLAREAATQIVRPS